MNTRESREAYRGIMMHPANNGLLKFATRSLFASGAIAIVLNLAPPALAAKFADFLFVVDESGSMRGEHLWLENTVMELEASLKAAGVGAGTQSNRFGLVGYGGRQGTFGNSILMNGNLFGSARDLANATQTLQVGGGFEDGYAAIDFALSNYQFRPDAAVNIVLITDEDRDRGKEIGFNDIFQDLQAENALLNAVVNHHFADASGHSAIGVDYRDDAFVADGTGGYTTHTGGIAQNGMGTTKIDYVDLAWATGDNNIGGAAWNLNVLRSGGSAAESFTSAFVAIKTKEALSIGDPPTPPTTSVPEPASLLGLLAMGSLAASSLMKRDRRSEN